jgi:hypothetical protein
MMWKAHCRLIVVLAMLGTGPAMTPAYAFNPQPDPPAKMLIFSNSLNQQKNLNDKGLLSSKGAVSPGPCKTGNSCQLPILNEDIHAKSKR